ncbi:DoxX family protein [Candidatus Uhrbacteria bacterium]|jgi:thiosulfate dehydrogenase (quinone) large subunit|nr:DoxX family protein [Candidatus Uhrbacteria bacterium]
MRKHTVYDRFCKQVNQMWFSIGLTVLRVALGVVFLVAGVSKLGDWSAAGYLQGSTGPLADWFVSLAGNPLVDFLNVWGLILIGSALLLGLLVRPASFFAAIMMFLYYFSQFEQNTEHGLIDDHIIYLLIFVLFLSGGVGHVFGLDGMASQRIRKQSWWSKALFG